jgi:hypothetical protein
VRYAVEVARQANVKRRALHHDPSLPRQASTSCGRERRTGAVSWACRASPRRPTASGCSWIAGSARDPEAQCLGWRGNAWDRGARVRSESPLGAHLELRPHRSTTPSSARSSGTSTGVSVITAVHEVRRSAWRSGPFASLSLDPPMVLFCPGNQSSRLAQDPCRRLVLRQHPRRRPGHVCRVFASGARQVRSDRVGGESDQRRTAHQRCRRVDRL